VQIFLQGHNIYKQRINKSFKKFSPKRILPIIFNKRGWAKNIQETIPSAIHNRAFCGAQSSMRICLLLSTLTFPSLIPPKHHSRSFSHLLPTLFKINS
jgi:hypothetical protein